tara:strand:- start:525 stop:674 length:150 start_codon:yes stop_codon:yes gene_type:complete
LKKTSSANPYTDVVTSLATPPVPLKLNLVKKTGESPRIFVNGKTEKYVS